MVWAQPKWPRRWLRRAAARSSSRRRTRALALRRASCRETNDLPCCIGLAGRAPTRTLAAASGLSRAQRLGRCRPLAALARAREQRRFRLRSHIDTGMSRLGLPAERARAARPPSRRSTALDLRLLISHLACADEPANPLNRAPAGRTSPRRGRSCRRRRRPSPIPPASFLARDYCRPGAARAPRFTASPDARAAQPDARRQSGLARRFCRSATLTVAGSVGYGAHAIERPRRPRIATVRSDMPMDISGRSSNRGRAISPASGVPLAGRVSMDLITFDVSDLPEAPARPGAMVQLIGPQQRRRRSRRRRRHHRLRDPDALGSRLCAASTYRPTA